MLLTKFCGVLLIILLFFMLSCNFNTSSNQAETDGGDESVQQIAQPKLSSNKKQIVSNNRILLEVDHQAIVNYFKTESQLCNNYSLNQPERKDFCTDAAIFKAKTKFNRIEVSSDKKAIGFSITSDVLSPDAVVGIFYPERSDKPIQFLSKYYLGNQFLSFSPNDQHFIYNHNCWEGFCGLTVKNTSTLKTVLEINNSENVDERNKKTVFEKWIDNRTIGYLIDGEPAKFSF